MVAASEGSQVSVDALLERLGVLGRYQVLQVTWQFLSNLTIAFQLLNVVFIAQDVQFRCAESKILVSDGVSSKYVDSNITEYGECDITIFNTTTNKTVSENCYSWEYAKGKSHSIVSEWDLVCDNVALSRLPQSLFVAGQGVGALVFSILSDKLGRKPFLLVCHIFTGGLGFALAFSPGIQVFIALRMLNGAFQQGVVVTLSTMILEIFPRNRRLEVATMSAIVWSACPLLLTLVAFLMRRETWGTLQLVFSAMSLCVVLELIFMDESLRWLVANGKYEQAKSVLKKAAKQNKVDVTGLISFYTSNGIELASKENPDVKTQQNGEKSEAGQYIFWDIFRSKFMLKISLIIWVTWMVDSLTYFSLYLTASSLADDLYLNFFLNSVAEVPTGFLFWILSRRIGRRKFFLLFHSISGVCLLIATAMRALTEGNAAATGATVFAFIGKVGSATCFTSLFVYVPEIYPTNLRTAGLGAGSTAARVGAAMAPFTSMLVKAIPWLPGTIFGAACLFVAFLGILLPEPEGRELPETIQEIESWDHSIPSRKSKMMKMEKLKNEEV